MVLIFSSAYDEISTEQVIDWLDYYCVPWYRINGEDLILNRLPTEDEGFLKNLRLDSIKAIWLRRTIKFNKLLDDNLMDKNQPDIIKNHYSNEFFKFYEYTYSKIINTIGKKVYCLNKLADISINKMIVLMKAEEIGIKVPQSFIANNKEDLNSNLLRLGIREFIFKPLSKVFYYATEHEYYIPYTVKMTKAILAEIPEKFIPSLVQEYIHKEFEIRTVYLEGLFFSMAIMSGSNQDTKDDFRNFQSSNPNYLIPYSLPNEVELQLTTLMKLLDLNFGSIDILLSDSTYYFLEVNPFGQFGMTSFPCNYNIEKSIAELLKSKIYENTHS